MKNEPGGKLKRKFDKDEKQFIKEFEKNIKNKKSKKVGSSGKLTIKWRKGYERSI